MHAVSLVPPAGALRATVSGSAFTTGSGRRLLKAPATCSDPDLVLKEVRHPCPFVQRRGRCVCDCLAVAWRSGRGPGILLNCLPVWRLATP